MLEYFAAIELQNETLYVTNAEANTMRTVAGVPVVFKQALVVGKIRAAFSSIEIAREIPGTASFEINNLVDSGGQSGWLDKYLGLGNARKSWNNRRVVLKYGGTDGSAWESMPLENVYLIQPGTLSHTRQSVEFGGVDIRQTQDVPMLVSKYAPPSEDNARGNFVATLYGDFTQGAGPDAGGRVRAFCSDTVAYTFKVASHAIGTGGNPNLLVWHHDQDGGPGNTPIVRQLVVGVDFTESLAGGGFTLLPAYVAAYPPDFDQDRFTVNCTGISAVPLVSGGPAIVLENAPDIMAHILTQVAGATVGEIDLAGSWLTALQESDQHRNRKWIGTQESTMAVVGQLLKENNFEMFVDGGIYRLRFYDPSDEIRISIDEAQLDNNGIRAEYDPEGTYTNRIVAQFDKNITDPDGAEYRGITEENDIDAQSEYGSIQTAQDFFQWLFDEATVLVNLQRQLFFRGGSLHYANVTIGGDELNPASQVWRLALSDAVELNGWQYDGELATIRSIERDVARGTVKLKLLIISGSFPVWYWSEDLVDSIVPMAWSTDTTDSDFPGKWS